MTSAPLPVLYRNISALDRNVDKALCLRVPSEPFGYAAGARAIPAIVDEFPNAAHELPILFAGGPERFISVFLLSFVQDRNAFVTSNGLWDATYIPAYIRRYPFILANAQGREHVICIDREFTGLGLQGQHLFEKDGANSNYLNGTLQFMSDFEVAARRTGKLCDRLREWSLLRPVDIKLRVGGAESPVAQGLFIVDEGAFSRLADEQFLALRHDGHLVAIYAHLLSLQALNNILKRQGHDRAFSLKKENLR